MVDREGVRDRDRVKVKWGRVSVMEQRVECGQWRVSLRMRRENGDPQKEK